MPYLIDAANLGGVLGGARGARNTEAILHFLLPWARNRKQVVVVFDGPERPEFAKQLGGVEIVWSGTKSADDVIAARVSAKGRGAKAWTVITNDQTLTRRCRDLGARVENASLFAHRAAESNGLKSPSPGARAPSQKPRATKDAVEKPAPNAQDIAHWRKIFGDKS
ncbi:MAG: NYN domain-containing protein [Thermoanaerobaculia bacterium]